MQPSALTKKEAMELSRTKTVWSEQEVRTILGGLKNEAFALYEPNIKVGDIFRHNGLHHMAIVISIKRGNAFAAILTTNPDTLGVVCPTNSRFAKSFITNTLIQATPEQVATNYVSPYENNKHLTEIRKLIKAHYKRNLL